MDSLIQDLLLGFITPVLSPVGQDPENTHAQLSSPCTTRLTRTVACWALTKGQNTAWPMLVPQFLPHQQRKLISLAPTFRVFQTRDKHKCPYFCRQRQFSKYFFWVHPLPLIWGKGSEPLSLTSSPLISYELERKRKTTILSTPKQLPPKKPLKSLVSSHKDYGWVVGTDL